MFYFVVGNSNHYLTDSADGLVDNEGNSEAQFTHHSQ